MRPRAHNLDAYTRYLRARFLIHQQSPETLQAALEQLRKLIEVFPITLWPIVASPWRAGFLCLFGVVSGRDVYPEVKANAERGYALDPESAETCTVLGGLRAWFEYRWGEADTLYERALQLQPGYAPAHMFRAMALLCQRNIFAAESGLRRSIELDPISASDCARMAYLHYVKGDYGSAAEHLKSLLSSIATIRKRDSTKDCCASSRKITRRSIQCLSLARTVGHRYDGRCLRAARQRGARWECVETLHRARREAIRHTAGRRLLLRSGWETSILHSSAWKKRLSTKQTSSICSRSSRFFTLCMLTADLPNS